MVGCIHRPYTNIRSMLDCRGRAVRSRELVLILDDNSSNDNSNRILYISSLLRMCVVLRCFVGRSMSSTYLTSTMFRL